MARMRTVKPALRTSAVVAAWPMAVRYAWVLLWGYLDDEGRGFDLPKAIAADLFPLDEEVTAAVIGQWLDQMTVGLDGTPGQGPLCRYEVGGRRYLHAVNWREHQKPNRPHPLGFPRCPIHDGEHSDSVNDSVNDSVSGSRLEYWRVGELEGAAVRESLNAPPRTCARHPTGTTRPCRACQRARETADADRSPARAPVPHTTRTKPDPAVAHRGAAKARAALNRQEP